MSDLPEQIREYARDEQRGLYTMVLAIIEKYDKTTHRCKVSLKDDRNVTIDEVPVASTYAGDGYGELFPIKEKDEGMLLCLKDPLDEHLLRRGHVKTPKHRQHSFQDAVFFPRFWLEPDQIPTHEQGEYLLAHESGSKLSMKMDGEARLEHASGSHVRLTTAGDAEIADSSGDITTTITDTGVDITAPNMATEFGTDPQSSISINENGTATIDAAATVGDTDANRVDTRTEDTDPETPWKYTEVDEPATPVVDPTTTESNSNITYSNINYTNPPTISHEGPSDHGLYETRRRVPERRAKDPDPTVTDPTDPRYIELPEGMTKIPIGYEYILTETWEYKMWGSSGAPVVIKAI